MLFIIFTLFSGSFSTKLRAEPSNKLTILHTNDIHSHYDPTNNFGTDCLPNQIKEGTCYGGVTRLKAAVDSIRKTHPNSLFLDGGDQFQGTMYYTYFKGNATWDIMNELGYDAMAIGNHEFDNGPSNLARVIKQFKFPVICANMEISDNLALSSVVKPYVYIPKYDIAIVGYITETTGKLSKAGLGIKFTDPIVAVQNVIDYLRTRGIKRIIGLSHNGYVEDKDLASHTRGLSLIVGGHSHSYLSPNEANAENKPYSQGPYPTSVDNIDGEKVYIVQAYCWGRFLGHIDIEFRPDGYLNSIKGEPIELTMDLPEDKSMVNLMNRLRSRFEDMGKKPVGEATQDFTVGFCTSQECAMGNLLTDAMLFQERTKNADIALINSGGIRATFSQGSITVQDVLTVLPFDNYVVQFDMKGQEIWNMIEAVIKQYSSVNSLPITSFIQISGLQFIYQPELSLLKEVNIYNQTIGTLFPLDLQKSYSIVTADFLASGGDNIITPPRTNLINQEIQSQGLMDYISLHTPIKPTLFHRIVALTDSSRPLTTPDIPSHFQYKQQLQRQPLQYTSGNRQMSFSRHNPRY